ncbi:MAG: carboxylating nicotinate-nucleotide diphosphorylase, partial [bacterium]
MEINQELLQELADRALAEDIGTGDITTAATVSHEQNGQAVITAKAAGIISGLDIAEMVFMRVDPDAKFSAKLNEADKVEPGKVIAEISGSLESILAAERTALNLLMHLSGIATLTAQFVAAIKGTKAKILDTRKTTPGLRLLEKRAVRSGGGANHRLGLYDMVLLKENHIAAAGSISAALTATLAQRAEAKKKWLIEVETRSTDEIKQALEFKIDRIMLDNFTPEQAAEAVQLIRKRKSKLEIEASGNIDLNNVRDYAETGVDFI